MMFIKVFHHVIMFMLLVFLYAKLFGVLRFITDASCSQLGTFAFVVISVCIVQSFQY